MKQLTIIVLIIISAAATYAANVEKALLMRLHGLTSEATGELIDVIYSNSSDADKSKALYELGSIAFDQRNINAAVETWTKLISKFPNSTEALLVKDRIEELAEMLGEVSKSSVEDVVARSYLGHAEFWSKNKDDIFQIDSSWLPKLDAAIKWYDKVITEYPKTAAAKLAYEGKLRTLLGWKDPGQYGQAWGVESDFKVYMPQVLSAFSAFESDFPNAGSLQAFRYQIAQAYWSKKDWAKTREWLNLIIGKSGEQDGFYKDLAQRRLGKVEY